MNPSIDTTGDELVRELEPLLLRTRAIWEERLVRIQSDRRRRSDPLVRDSADQAIQRENDATLDALDLRGRDALRAVDAALERIAEGRFGRCVACGAHIDDERLRAQPTASACAPCARRSADPSPR